MSIDLEADFRLQLGEKLDRFTDAVDKLFARMPIPYTWESNADATTDTYTILPCFPFPVPAGRVYDLRHVAISGAGTSGDPFTTLAGATAVLTRGNAMTWSGKGSATQGRGFTSSGLDGSPAIILDPYAWDGAQQRVPATKAWGRGTITLKPGEQIFILIKGAANGVHLYSMTQIESYPITAFLQP